MNFKALIRYFKHMTIGRRIKRAQALVRRYIPEGRSLADELIAERRAEAQQEEQQSELYRTGRELDNRAMDSF
jgi:deoxyribodipyrimidine photolyase